MRDLISKAKGCLLGLACGDAVGTTLEFKSREWIKSPLTEMVGGGKFKLERGKWTDDTSMAICLAESLIECQGFEPIDQLKRYWRWASEGHNSSTGKPFGLGKHTMLSLFEFNRSGNPYSQRDNPQYSGNGSLMRLAPISLFYRNSLNLAEYARLSSKTTHASEECLQACEYFAFILQNALNGAEKENLFDCKIPENFDRLPMILAGEFKIKTAEQIKGSGYVVESLEAALWAFWHTKNFREAILLAANLGDDADTTAAICGQLAGAYYGLEGIPKTWLEWLYRKADIERLAVKLLETSGQI